MSKLILTRGVPASGKSTFAKEWVAEDPSNRVRVNRDNERKVVGITGGVGSYEQEQEVTFWTHTRAERALKAGKDVIVDETNLRARNVKEWLKLAARLGAEVEFVDFPIGYLEAAYRDSERGKDGGRSVGGQVIDSFFKKYVGKDGTLPPIPTLDAEVVASALDVQYVPDTSKPRAVGFDIDGTLARMVGRGPYDTSLYHTDTVHTEVLAVLRALAYAGYEILILSGRSDEFLDVLINWLGKNNIWYDQIFMRKAGDQRNDAIVKAELFDKHIAPNYNFIMQFDDRQRVVDAFRSKGIKVAQVEPGDF